MAMKSTFKKPGFGYTEVQASTSSPGKRVVMMYDGILKNLRIAIDKLTDAEPEDFEEIHNALALAERLITELRLALDHKLGGEISQNLEGLYEFWVFYISEANINKDVEKIQSVYEQVSALREAWDEAAKEAIKMGISSNV
ncbi:MAG: flagellar export chaperone FliS [Lentisphaeria bacterium]|nr:flagellar export chaperone FliS [Lentisphaeria bacterium]NQZ69418.1 flagellar export chaperone FliS [Lentisphaeria bacterium]